MTVVGVDGCRIGWVAAVLDVPAEACTIAVYRSFGELLAATHEARVIAVDIPIGLAASGPRAADTSARRYLGVRGSTVFPAPCRPAILGTTYEDSSARSFEASGKRLSKQTYGIIPKIREVDHALRADPALTERVVEVHPEVSFALMNGSEPVVDSKKRASGQLQRLALLPRLYREAFEEVRLRWLRKDVATDDILDALAALWSAHRILTGAARAFPPTLVERDTMGWPMRILA